MCLYFLLSFPDKRSAFRGSLDCRIKSGNDKKKNKSEYDREEAGDDRGKRTEYNCKGKKSEDNKAVKRQ